MRMSLVPRSGKKDICYSLSLKVSLAFANGILEEVRAMTVQPFPFDVDKISLSLLGFN